MNRRDMLRRLALGASGLVAAESVRDFMAWEAKRIFALGGVGPYYAEPVKWILPPSITWDMEFEYAAIRREAGWEVMPL